jgi:four helix bundle protein
MKADKEKLWDIRKRSFEYALRAIRVYQALQRQKDGAGWLLGKQFLRSATSVGADIAEAQSAESRADFVHKYGIAQKEAKESLYWLRLLEESGLIPNDRLVSIIGETEELIAVITTIVLKAKRMGHEKGAKT